MGRLLRASHLHGHRLQAHSTALMLPPSSVTASMWASRLPVRGLRCRSSTAPASSCPRAWGLLHRLVDLTCRSLGGPSWSAVGFPVSGHHDKTPPPRTWACTHQRALTFHLAPLSPPAIAIATFEWSNPLTYGSPPTSGKIMTALVPAASTPTPQNIHDPPEHMHEGDLDFLPGRPHVRQWRLGPRRPAVSR